MPTCRVTFAHVFLTIARARSLSALAPTITPPPPPPPPLNRNLRYKTSVSVTLVSTHCVDIVPEKWKSHRSAITDANCLCPTYDLRGGFSVFLPELAFVKITLTKHGYNKEKVIGLR